jgi:solute carrier family 39 (zinc transporter), member 9
MLLVEQVLLPSSSSSSSSSSNRESEYALAPNSAASFDGLPTAQRPGGFSRTRSGVVAKNAHLKARSITFGLVIHSLADGLALGASAFSASLQSKSPHKDPHHPSPSHTLTTLPPQHQHDTSKEPSMTDELTSNPLTLIVFLALLIHKIPTALALSTSLLSLLPPRKIRLHVGIFSIATPLGALLSFVLLGLAEAWSFAESEIEGGGKGSGKNGTGSGAHPSGLWAGIALAFSGGTFLYVATVLQPVRGGHGSSSEGANQTSNADGPHNRSMEDLHAHPSEDDLQHLGPKTRVILIVLGMFLPIVVSSMIGHGHGHGH